MKVRNTLIIGLGLILTFIGLGSVFMSEAAHAAPTAKHQRMVCTVGHVNSGYLIVGETAEAGSDPFDPEVTIHDYNCRKDGFRIYRAEADTQREVDVLEKMAIYYGNAGFINLMCSTTPGHARYLSPAWNFGPTRKYRESKILGWNKFMRRYQAHHAGCVRYLHFQ